MAGTAHRGLVALDTNAVHDYYASVSLQGPKAALIREVFDADLVMLPPAVLSEVLK